MKITQSNDQMEIKTSGLGQLIFGIIMVIAGIGVIFLLLGSTSSDGSKSPAWTALIGLAIAIVGALMVIFAKNRSTTIQKGGETTVSDKRMLGGSAKQQSVPTANITAVMLSTYIQQSEDMNNRNTRSRRSTLSLMLNNNDVLQVGSSGQNGFGFNGMNIGGLIMKAPLSKEANQIATFLGIPLQTEDTSTIAGAVKSVKSAFGQTSEPQQPTEFNPGTQPNQQPSAQTPTTQPPTSNPVPPAGNPVSSQPEHPQDSNRPQQ